ncbi:nucleoside recognition domain-containing protein [Vibrio sp. M60_M70]|uniref:nucleoside recognition domain-containing protein n=1 Tax=Vibrio sp. M60_M70 TaxID=3035166 RepID=UPI00301E01D8
MTKIIVDDSLDKVIDSYKELIEIIKAIDFEQKNHVTSQLNDLLKKLEVNILTIEDEWSLASKKFFKAIIDSISILTNIYVLPESSGLKFNTDLILDSETINRDLLDKKVQALLLAIKSYGIVFTVEGIDMLGNDVTKLIKSEEITVKKVASFQEDIDKLKDTNLQEIENKAKEIEEIISNRIVESDHQIVQKINNNTNEATKKLDNLSKQFTESYSTWSNKLSEEREEIIFKAEMEISKLQAKIESLSFVLESNIRKEVNSFANQKKKLTDILGSLSEFRRSKSDIDQAEKEKKTANQFRWLGLFMMLLPLAAFILFFVGFTANNNGVSSLTFVFPDEVTGYFLRFLTIILFSSPSVYLLKESAYHRGQERHYRERGLQLASIGPYLEEFTPEKRIEAKQQLMDNFYRHNEGKADTSNVPDFIKNMNEAVKLAHAIKTPSANEPSKKEQTNTVNG